MFSRLNLRVSYALTKCKVSMYSRFYRVFQKSRPIFNMKKRA